MSLMSNRSLVAAAAAAFATFGVAQHAGAQPPPIKPGLWEIKGDADSSQKSAAAADRLNKLPPEQRAQIESMMKQKGISMAGGGATRMCLNKESFDTDSWQHESSCKVDYKQRSGSSWKWHSVCAEGRLESDGEAIFGNAENYTVKTTTTSTFGGAPKISQRTMTGHWLGSNCGDLKPLNLKR